MSRLIKVRIWDKETKQYVENAIDCQIDWTLWDFTNFNLKFKDRIIVEQYTGLKDKFGKKIYEGDIIHRGALSKANVFRNSVICFDEESVGFIATSTRNGARTLFNGHTCGEIEVIGNIHENPELLGGK